MSYNRMLALVAILAGGLMVGACGDSVTGPAYDPGPGSALKEPGLDGVTDLPPGAEINDPEGNHHEKNFPRRGKIE